MTNKKILIIGKNSYLFQGLELDKKKFYIDVLQRPSVIDYTNYDIIINFCIQPEHFTRLLSQEEMIDTQIVKNIVNSNTRFIFLSSRKVYGSNFDLKEYNENDELKPKDFYAKNKVAIEKSLMELIPQNITILRTGNIIGTPPKKPNYKTFIGWIENEIKEKGKVDCTILPETKKDFITKEYFQEVLKTVIDNEICGTYNVGAGFAIPIKDILLNLLPEHTVDFTKATKIDEQFILNCDKINKFVKPFTKENLLDKCNQLKNIQWNSLI